MITFEEPVLTAADEHRLARTVEAGVLARELLEAGTLPLGASTAELRVLQRDGELAQERFVAANLRLVALVAKPVALRAGLDYDDLFQEGVLGLVEAVRRYDHTRGARFATFALPWIRMRVNECAVTRCGSLGIPVSRARQRVQVLTARDGLEAALGRTPTLAEIAERAGRSVDVVSSLLAYSPPARLVDQDQADTPSENEPLDPLAIRRMLRVLTPDERRVIVRLYGLAPHPVMSVLEVATELGISRSTVRRREQSALQRLRGCAELLDAA